MPVCDFCGRAVRCQQMRDRLGLWWWCGRCPRDDAPPTTYELSMNSPKGIAMNRRIYVASSWRCPTQPAVVQALRDAGHEVYDFRNPPEATGFAWSEIDPEWLDWTVDAYRDKLGHPRAVQGFTSDFDAMQWADTFVLVLPCGRSAHLELGWAVGQGKRTAILLSQDKFEPELMYRMVDKLAVSLDELLDWTGREAQQRVRALRAEAHAEAAEQAVHRVRGMAEAWATQPNDYDEDTEQQIEDGNAILRALGGGDPT